MLSKKNELNWRELEKLIRSQDRFLISSHVHTDGDAVGSSLAFKRILERLGKEVWWVMDEDPGDTFTSFIRPNELILHNPNERDYSNRKVIVMLDAGEWKRLGRIGELLEHHPGEKLCIDHHIPKGDFPGLRIVDCSAPSTTTLIYRFARYLGLHFTLDIAEPIYLGLIVDTQNFHLPNTTMETHKIAGECLEAGVNPTKVHEPIYGTLRFSRVRLLSEAFQNTRVVFKGKVGVIFTTKTMFEHAKAKPWDDDGFVDIARSIEGVSVGIYFREENGGKVKVSWRSRGSNDVSVSARRFGGGGHMRACGATLNATLDEARVKVLTDMKERIAKGEIT